MFGFAPQTITRYAAITDNQNVMTAEEFQNSLKKETPPDELSGALLALWLDAKDDWAGAHAAAQSEDNANGAWVHAYLHRKEGEFSNARYWYARAGKPEFAGTLDEEWRHIATELQGNP